MMRMRNIPPGFFKVVVEFTFRGNAVSIKVESESITTRPVSLGGNCVSGCANNPSRCASVGVEKW
jgi:hypothetical protein